MKKVSKTRYLLPLFFFVLGYLLDQGIIVLHSRKWGGEDSSGILFILAVFGFLLYLIEDLYIMYKEIKEEKETYSMKKYFCNTLTTFVGLYLVFLALGFFQNFIFAFIAVILMLSCEKIQSYIDH